MRYAQMRSMDISNGTGIGVSLFVQGCHRHCKNCFNKETWDFDDGKEWTEEVEKHFFTLIDKPYITRVTILGGEPLAYENLPCVYDIVKKIRTKFPNKQIWLYTGMTLDCGMDKHGLVGDFANADTGWDNALLRNHIIRNCDIVVDGDYKDEQRDLTLAFRGSKNQRIIDVKETMKQGKIALWGDSNRK